MLKHNLFSEIPSAVTGEVFEDIVNSPHVRIERIVSFGEASPAQGWYDQQEDEWVVVLSGAAGLLFEHGESVTLQAGDYANIPAHTKHKVAWTAADQPTIWLAVFSPAAANNLSV